jgi:hypothetical protein
VVQVVLKGHLTFMIFGASTKPVSPSEHCDVDKWDGIKVYKVGVTLCAKPYKADGTTGEEFVLREREDIVVQ